MVSALAPGNLKEEQTEEQHKASSAWLKRQAQPPTEQKTRSLSRQHAMKRTREVAPVMRSMTPVEKSIFRKVWDWMRESVG